jgi:hypothetical protein
MPALRVEVDGCHAATIRCNDFHVVSARVSGSLVEEPFATVEMTASTHPNEGKSTYLIWLNEVEVRAGQAVTIHFLEDANTTGLSRTIVELYPNEPDVSSQPDKPLAECFRELRAKPNLRAGYTFAASTPGHSNYQGSTAPGEYSFSFHALWNWMRPARASVSLSSWTIDNVELNTPSREHIREYISPNQSATFCADA